MVHELGDDRLGLQIVVAVVVVTFVTHGAIEAFDKTKSTAPGRMFVRIGMK
jgi:hypothetical protein